jgi:uncharacterized protein
MWRKLNGHVLPEPILVEVEKVLRQETKHDYNLKVCIGTDSQVRGMHIDFATVIVFLREQRGGFMYINTENLKRIMSIKERMLYEVSRSIEVAHDLCDLLDRYNIDLEVHADINTNPEFKSNSALKEAMGYIMSMGFVFKAKPEAFASTACANKIVN